MSSITFKIRAEPSFSVEKWDIPTLIVSESCQSVENLVKQDQVEKVAEET